MESYELFFKKSAVRELKVIPATQRSRILKIVSGLATDPRPNNCEKLSGDGKFRVRQGDYRIVYSVDDAAGKIVVFRVAHRKDVYR